RRKIRRCLVTVEKHLTYRGEIKAVVGVGGTLAFVAVHPEGQPGAFYRLDADRLTIDTDPMPKGGTALATDGETVWVAGGDGRLSEVVGPGAPKPLGAAFDASATALAPLAGGRLAALIGSQVVILSREDG